MYYDKDVRVRGEQSQYLPDELRKYRRVDGWETTHVEINEHGGSEEVTEIHETLEQIPIQGTEWYREQALGLAYYEDVLVVFKGPKDNVAHLSIKEGTRTIVSDACAGLSKTEIVIPDSVVEIGKNAFKDVPNIIYHGKASGAPWGAKCVNGCIEGDYVFSDKTKTKLMGYFGPETDISLPQGVKEIGDKAFYLGQMQSVDIPNTVERIGSRAFSYCTSLRAISIPNGIKKIENGTFKGCKLLEKVDLPETIKEICDFAFSHCESLHSMAIPNGITKIGCGAFDDCKSLKDITIPETEEEIGGAFSKERECRPGTDETNTIVKNNEGKIFEVHLKEKWYVSIKRTPVSFGIIVLFFIVAPLIMMIVTVANADPAGWSPSDKAGAILSAVCFLFFFIVNIPIIKRMIAPAEFVVKTNDGTLSIARNGKEKYSIAAQNTNQIVLNRFRKEFIGMGIFEEEPKLVSKRKGYVLRLAFVPKEERQELMKLLCGFYGEQRLRIIMSVGYV